MPFENFFRERTSVALLINFENCRRLLNRVGIQLQDPITKSSNWSGRLVFKI